MSSRDEILAGSLDASDTRLLPLLPYLLQDLYELGSEPRVIAQLIADHMKLDEDSRIIDIGCGKGAVSHELAVRFGCHVEGRDLTGAFIAEARERAAELASWYPDLSPLLIRYVEDQQAECDALGATLMGVTWLLRRQ